MTEAGLSDSDELLYIYITLRKLNCIQVSGSNQKALPLESLIFPKRFLLKQLNERLQSLDELAAGFCTDLFRQISGLPDNSSDRKGQPATQPINLRSDDIRYPEFDEYFHFCLHQLHDFMTSLRWHEADVERLAKSDADYVSNNLEFVNYLFAFQSALVEMVRENQSKISYGNNSPIQKTSSVTNGVAGKKSIIRSPRRSSPEARRRVRFKDLSPADSQLASDSQQAIEPQNDDLVDNHSVLALDLLIYAVNIYIQRLADTLIVWSNGVQIDLTRAIDTIFESKVRVRARQLQMVAKKIKCYNDVHLTVLDHLSEIKRRYLIKHVRGTLLSKDSRKLLSAYKNPRLQIYIHRIGVDVEVNILARLTRECLQIFFNLIVIEINFDSVDSHRANKATKNKSQENILNFMANWLKVDDVLFGYNAARQAPTENNKQISLDLNMKPTFQIQLTKGSTLSLNERFKSSSRILAQMDNLGEFMRDFLHMIIDRLRYPQQVRYFLESIASGIMQFYDIVGPKLEQQYLEIEARDKKNTPKTQSANHGKEHKKVPDSAPLPLSADMLSIKIRCLKFIHIIGLTDRTIANEAARLRVELSGESDLDLKLARLTQICMGSKLKTDKER